jgi:hypothetical protein
MEVVETWLPGWELRYLEEETDYWLYPAARNNGTNQGPMSMVCARAFRLEKVAKMGGAEAGFM